MDLLQHFKHFKVTGYSFKESNSASSSIFALFLLNGSQLFKRGVPLICFFFCFVCLFVLGGGGVSVVVVVVLLFYVHGKHLRSCRDGQLT